MKQIKKNERRKRKRSWYMNIAQQRKKNRAPHTSIASGNVNNKWTWEWPSFHFMFFNEVTEMEIK